MAPLLAVVGALAWLVGSGRRQWLSAAPAVRGRRSCSWSFPGSASPSSERTRGPVGPSRSVPARPPRPGCNGKVPCEPRGSLTMPPNPH